MDAQETNATAAKPIGRTLAEERERQGLSRLDVAQRLHMSAYQVEALEAGDFQRLPKGTFLRGFVRNYAKLLGMPADSVLPLLAESTPDAKRPGIVVPTQNIRFDPIGERFANPYVKAGALAFVAIAVGFAGMYWWLFIRPTPPGGGPRHAAAEPAAPQPAPVVNRPPAITPPPAEPATNAAVAAPAKVATDAAVATPAKAGAQSPTAPGKTVVEAGTGGTLKFRFRGESWVEIRDARGKVILSKLNPAGSEAEVSGRPPFNVIVGNAPEVELFYNNQEFDLEPHTKVAVARFTVE
jgi:cytoskeleton protein RodZ